MKIRVNTVLRGSEFCADIGDMIEVDEKIGDSLINIGAATEIIEIVAEKFEEKIIEKPIKKQIEEIAKPKIRK